MGLRIDVFVLSIITSDFPACKVNLFSEVTSGIDFMKKMI